MQELPYSPACDRNKEPIAQILRAIFKADLEKQSYSFLELGFGTLQHALYFCQQFPQLHYFASDQSDYHPLYLAHQQRALIPKNLEGPFLFQALSEGLRLETPRDQFDFIYSANTLHIMGHSEALSLLKEIPQKLSAQGHLLFYGPFKFSGKFTSESNQQFDIMLKERDPKSGIRDFEEVKTTLESKGLEHIETIDMPANNHILHFMRKR